MFVKFKCPWGKYDAGSIDFIEYTLAVRLIGIGICEKSSMSDRRAKIEKAAVIVKPEPKKIEPEPDAAPKKKPGRPKKRRTKAVEKAIETDK